MQELWRKFFNGIGLNSARISQEIAQKNSAKKITENSARILGEILQEFRKKFCNPGEKSAKISEEILSKFQKKIYSDGLSEQKFCPNLIGKSIAIPPEILRAIHRILCKNSA